MTDTTGKPVATVLELTLTIVFVLGCLTVILLLYLPKKIEARVLGVHWVYDVYVYDTIYDPINGYDSVYKTKYQTVGESKGVVSPAYILSDNEYTRENVTYFVDFLDKDGEVNYFAVSKDMFMEATANTDILIYVSSGKVIKIVAVS